MSVFEILMLLCFGLSWPISISKALRTKHVVGKSPMFMLVVCAGYVCGALHKLLYSFDAVIILYSVNMTMVAFDLLLYYRYEKLGPRRVPMAEECLVCPVYAKHGGG